MRMWHPDLLPLLCNKDHIGGQWKEFFMIVGHLKAGHSLRIAIKNRNINIHIMLDYYQKLLNEMNKRQIKIKRFLTEEEVDLIRQYIADNPDDDKPLSFVRDIIDLSLRCPDCLKGMMNYYQANKKYEYIRTCDPDIAQAKNFNANFYNAHELIYFDLSENIDKF